jgi:hypothetical protein
MFDSNGLITPGFAHAIGTAQVIIAAAGDYQITYKVSTVENSQFTLFKNGLPLPQTTSGATGPGSPALTVILPLASADVLTLRNHTSASSVTLQLLTGGTQAIINASLVILKLK